jgi:hypothetical protein
LQRAKPELKLLDAEKADRPERRGSSRGSGRAGDSW